jgi:hypothetical protein
MSFERFEPTRAEELNNPIAKSADVKKSWDHQPNEKLSKEWESNEKSASNYDGSKARDLTAQHLTLENNARKVDHPTPEELLSQLWVDSPKEWWNSGK